MKTQVAIVIPAREMDKSNVWTAVKLIHAQRQKIRKQRNGDILELGKGYKNANNSQSVNNRKTAAH